MKYDYLVDKDNILQFDIVVDEVLLNLIPGRYHYESGILEHLLDEKKWVLKLSNTVKEVLVLLAQDFINITNGKSPELEEIEEFYIGSDVNRIIVLHWNHNLKQIYNGPLHLVEFPMHSFEFAQHLRNRYKEWENVNNKSNTVAFMCLNGLPKRHRKKVYNYLQTLLVKGITTLSTVPNTYDFASYTGYNWDNVTNYVSMQNVYRSTPVNIVTESLYNEPSGIITEKTLMAFASLQLPILIAHKGAVADVRRYGFDMFDDILDNSYDNLPNNIRWKSAIDKNTHILRGEFNYEELLPRLKKNQDYLLNGYLDYIETEFIRQMGETLQDTNQNLQTS